MIIDWYTTVYNTQFNNYHTTLFMDIVKMYKGA